MAIEDLFSRREERKAKHRTVGTFQYDELPKEFRVQVVHIWRDALGVFREVDPYSFTSEDDLLPNRWWTQIVRTITREKGLFSLVGNGGNPDYQCVQFMMEAGTLDALDLIEVTFRRISQIGLDTYLLKRLRLIPSDQAIDELNGRFRQHSIGYEFIGGKIIRVDSIYIHAEAVGPAVELLQDGGTAFSGPLEEFMRAHEYYRRGESKDAISWALKAFESTLKAICLARRWSFDPNKDTASKLVEIVFEQKLLPAYLESHVKALRSLLESGVPTIRNKTSGHGQGAVPTQVPEYFARFVLNLTASNILFLLESHKALN